MGETATPLTGLTALVADLDGVITQTADAHFTAWKALFDDVLRKWEGADVQPFTHRDYTRYVDGLPRYDGIESFLKSRGIEVPRGDPADSPETDTVCGLGNRKNIAFNRVLDEEGVTVFDGAVSLLRALRDRGWKTACVSSSKNCRKVLDVAGLTALFDVILDGQDAVEANLPGKPAPDTFVRAAENLGIDPSQAAVAEDALSGVAAGRAGGFGLVIGIDRGAGAEALAEHGADVVVGDLGELKPPG